MWAFFSFDLRTIMFTKFSKTNKYELINNS